MSPFLLEATKSTPKIVFDPDFGIFEISGKSRPEHVSEFYDPIFKWLNDYNSELSTFDKKINISFTINFSYLNTSSEKTILRLVKKLKEFILNGHTAEVVWCYSTEDEDIREMGTDFQGLSDVPFTFKAVD